MSIAVVDSDAIIAQHVAARAAIIPPRARDPSIIEFIEFMVGTSLVRTSLSCGRQSFAISYALHSYSKPIEYRVNIELSRILIALFPPAQTLEDEPGSTPVLHGLSDSRR